MSDAAAAVRAEIDDVAFDPFGLQHQIDPRPSSLTS
jgi:hypothetical protein